MDARIETDFAVWMRRMGFKNAVDAGHEIGFAGKTRAAERRSGATDLTTTERLAMSAVRAGLKPWTPSYDLRIAKSPREAEVPEQMKAELERLQALTAELSETVRRLSESARGQE